jgi:cyclopropane-fatty-acyl-phospholipid synthase
MKTFPATRSLNQSPLDTMATGLPQAAPASPADRPVPLPASAPRAARLVLRLLHRLQHGSLALALPDGAVLRFGAGEPRASIRLSNWKLFDASLRSGDVGFAETFIDGDWHADSLIAVLDLVVANRRVLEEAVYGSWWGGLLHRLRHLLNRNTRAGSRRNIHAHYDLGNPFYRLWLDPSMTYSSALFEGDASRTLQQAQRAKYRRIVDELALPAGSPVLEIGCGWGGFAEEAARAGLSVKGLTLSTEQLAYARERLAGEGLDRLARFELQDYRDERASYAGIASIEMFEAVGEAYWPDYFATLRRCLAPGGRAVVQTITIDDALFERYRRGTDFIQQYVFPGGMLPSPSAFEAQARRAGLRVTNRLAFGQDYATTLRLWRESFQSQLPQVRALGFDTRFLRTWEFYLAYCEAAFRHRNTDVVQFTLEHA